LLFAGDIAVNGVDGKVKDRHGCGKEGKIQDKTGKGVHF